MLSGSATAVVAEDSADLYNRVIKWIAVPILLFYSLQFLVSAYGPAADAEQNDSLVRVGADSGLRMDLHTPMPEWLVQSHATGAVVLVLLMLAQKEVVVRMARAYSGNRQLHKYIGFAGLAACAVMDIAGYALGRYSAFDSFTLFSVFFAAPFAVFGVATLVSAKLRWWRVHALCANMILKGCLATPISRLGGATLQHLGWPTAAGYYQGIFGVTAVVSLWQLADLYAFLAQPTPTGAGTIKKKS
eukprot:m.74762 g.74762  ORF g.74762 m.74762 type:complete len:245 (+) comp10337_c0_seq1:94-828(+)